MKSLFKTVAVVTIFSVCEKFLGFMYRIFLSRTIGSEGMGLYQVALSVFALLFTLTCSGTPITVSRLMTKYRAEGAHKRINGVITAGLSFTLLVAVPIVLCCFLFRSKLNFFFADDRCVNIFLIMLPGLIFTSVYSVLRGVFWGNKDFLPYSIIELLEEICMIITGIILISGATSVFQGAMDAGIAVLVSYCFSFSLAVIVFFFRKNKIQNPYSEFKPLLSSALPITAMRTANSLIVSVVSVVLPMRLMACGMTSSEAMSAYGSAVGQAIPIIYIPATLIGSFILVITPELSEDFYRGKNMELKNDIEKSLKFTVLVSAVFVPVFIVCGEEIGVFLYGSLESGTFLKHSGYLIILIGISTVTTSMLNSIGLETKTLIYFIISTVFMLIAVIVLPKFMGIYSLLVGYFFVYGITSVLNLILIHKTCKEKPRYLKFLFSAMILTLPSIILGVMLEKMLLPLLGTTVTLFAVAVILAAFTLLLYIGFGLVSIKYVKTKIPRFKKTKLKKVSAVGK